MNLEFLIALRLLDKWTIGGVDTKGILYPVSKRL